jgi:excisionase family DNA binding protein
VAALSISGAAFTSKHHNATMNQASTITSINSGDRPPGDLISIGRLSQYLGCSERHIYNLRKRGLPVFEIGDMVRFDLAAVRRWLAAQQKGAAKIKSA